MNQLNWLNNKIPPPVVTLVTGALMYAASLELPAFSTTSAWPLGLSMVIVILAVSIVLAGVYEFAKHKTTINPHTPDKSTSLVGSGIYRFTRNPMYLGMALFLCAWMVFLQSPLVATGVVAFIAYINRFQIVPEEKSMVKLFGKSYQQYQMQVPRWV